MSNGGATQAKTPSGWKIVKPVYGGDFLANASEGAEKHKAIFVPLVLPGELVHGRVVEEKRSFCRGELVEVVSPAASRVKPLCRHFGVCGGCQYQHADYSMQTAMKLRILKETFERSRLAWEGEIELLSAAEPSHAWGYRNRIRLAVTGTSDVSYRARRSHDLLPIEECPIAAPMLLEAAKKAAAYLRSSLSPARVAEMELFMDPAGSHLFLTLFVEPGAMPTEAWIEGLRDALPLTEAGIRVQLVDGALTSAVMAQAGPQWMQYEVAGYPYQVGHGAFFQVNRWLLSEFVELVLDSSIGEGAGREAWDLFAGVGLFARRLAERFERVVAVEAAAASWDGLRHNIAGTGAVTVAGTTLEFLKRNREERQARPDLIVMDPPRAGLGADVTTLLNAIHSPRMVYVSCDPATLARDLKALTAERFRIERVTMADMFPQTFHIETVVRLVRI